MKKIALLVAIPVVTIVALVLALVLLVNPNQFKPLIVDQAKQQTGLDLVIDGDISWQFFPSIGFTLGQTELRNPPGFTQPNMFKVEQVGVDVSVMPLFSKQLDIGQITLDGAEFYLETRKNGVKNIDALSQHQAQSSQAAEQTSTKSESEPAQPQVAEQPWTISLAGVAITNALFDIQDQQTGSHTKLYDVSLTLAGFAFDQWSKADFAAKGETNKQKFSADGAAEIKLAQGFSQYALRNIVFDASYSDASNQIDVAKIELTTFEFDKANSLKYSVEGLAADLEMNLKGSAQLTVDKAISKVTLNQLVLDGNLEGVNLPQSPMKVDMASDLSFDLGKNHLSFVLEKLTANALQFDGKLDVTLAEIPKIVFNLHSPNIDVDAFLSLDNSAEQSNSDSKSASASSQEKSAMSASAPEQEPDLSALKSLAVNTAGELF